MVLRGNRIHPQTVHRKCDRCGKGKREQLVTCFVCQPPRQLCKWCRYTAPKSDGAVHSFHHIEKEV